MSKEQAAIYYPDGSSQTRTQVRRRLLADELTQPLQRTKPPSGRKFEDWQPIMERRTQEYKELLAIPETVEIEIATERPILVGLFGDVHALHPECDLQRFGRDIDLVKEAGGYFMTFGDLTDSVFWNHVPGLASNQEAMLYMQSALRYMSEDGALLCAWLGDHDGWVFDKHNAHTLYQDFYNKFGAHLLDGVSYVDIGLNNGEEVQKYAIIGSHRHKGFSVYSDVHASWRQYNDEAKHGGNVISITAHNHTKGHSCQTRKAFGGQEVVINSISLGTYKSTDRYSRKHGWPRKSEETAGTFGLILFPNEDRAQVFWNLDQAVDFLSKY